MIIYKNVYHNRKNRQKRTYGTFDSKKKAINKALERGLSINIETPVKLHYARYDYMEVINVLTNKPVFRIEK